MSGIFTFASKFSKNVSVERPIEMNFESVLASEIVEYLRKLENICRQRSENPEMDRTLSPEMIDELKRSPSKFSVPSECAQFMNDLGCSAFTQAEASQMNSAVLSITGSLVNFATITSSPFNVNRATPNTSLNHTSVRDAVNSAKQILCDNSCSQSHLDACHLLKAVCGAERTTGMGCTDFGWLLESVFECIQLRAFDSDSHVLNDLRRSFMALLDRCSTKEFSKLLKHVMDALEARDSPAMLQAALFCLTDLFQTIRAGPKRAALLEKASRVLGRLASAAGRVVEWPDAGRREKCLVDLMDLLGVILSKKEFGLNERDMSLIMHTVCPVVNQQCVVTERMFLALSGALRACIKYRADSLYKLVHVFLRCVKYLQATVFSSVSSGVFNRKRKANQTGYSTEDRTLFKNFLSINATD
eukprot:656233_1